MKVLVVTPNPPWEKGGIERVVGETIRRVKDDIDIAIYCSSINKNIKCSNWCNIPVEVFKRLRHFPWWPMDLYSYMKKNVHNFNLIHVHGSGSLDSLIAILANRNNITPICITPHYHPVGSSLFFRILKKTYDPLVTNYILQKAKKIICVSNIEKQFILDRFGGYLNDKIIIIPNGINYDQIHNAKPYDFNGELILYAGRIEKYKNIHFVIEAMKYLPSKNHFYIIGDGLYRRNFEKMIARLNLSDRVKILGSVSDAEMHKWIKTCSVFVNLSEIEAFGITVLEALAAGKPVIVNNKLALGEHAKKFKGAVFPVDAEKIKLEDLAELIREVSNKQVNVDLSEYNWNNIAKQIQMIYLDEFSVTHDNEQN